MKETYREDLIDEILNQPDKILKAEQRVHSCKIDLVAAKDRLVEEENHLLLTPAPEGGGPLIDGKNEAIRQAQLQSFTQEEHKAVRTAEIDVMYANREYNFEVNTFHALQSVAALLSGEKNK